MNYRHLYHAGNFADVLKHCVLIMLAETLLKKPAPLLYLDTHAGTGKYDLTSVIAQKTKEYESGVERIYNTGDLPETIQTYKDIIKKINHNSKLRFYPGSPLIMHTLLRPQDRMILLELHQEDVHELKHNFFQDPIVAVHRADGYSGLKTFLPPKHGRGLILIDPAFEEKNEFTKIISGLEIALNRFPNGVYMIWYPIKNFTEIKSFYKKLYSIQCKNILAIELIANPDIIKLNLNACGMIIINAPWQFEIALKPIISYLCNILFDNSNKKYDISWIKKTN